MFIGRVLRLRRNAYWYNFARFDSLLFVELAQSIMGKGVLFVTPPLEDCITGPTGSSIQAGTG